MTAKDHDVRVTNRRKVFDDFFVIEAADVSLKPDGASWTHPRRLLSFERGDSAAALLVDPKRETALLARQFRFPTQQKGPGWIDEIVAGMIDVGEDPETAIRREILEETGYEARAVKRLFHFYPSPGGSSERIFLFCAEIDLANPSGPGGGEAGEGEFIDLVHIPFSDIANRLSDGTIIDAKTLIALQWFVAQTAPR